MSNPASLESSPAPPRRLRAGDPRIRVLIFITILLAALAVVVASLAASASSSQDRATSAALSYARQYMTWYQGPTAESTHVVALRDLNRAVAAYVPPTVRPDVNVADLVRQYGPDKQVALVILRGTFNSLPPDEGVTVHGGVVAIVDTRDNHVLLLTD